MDMIVERRTGMIKVMMMGMILEMRKDIIVDMTRGIGRGRRGREGRVYAGHVGEG